MSGPITLLFVSGPEDGKRVVLKSRPGRNYRVAMLPKLPTYVPVEEAPPSLDLLHFTYAIEVLPGNGNYVAYPEEWDTRDYPLETLMTALLRGYVGRQL